VGCEVMEVRKGFFLLASQNGLAPQKSYDSQDFMLQLCWETPSTTASRRRRRANKSRARVVAELTLLRYY
jgi:hypothetical protein